MNYQKLVLVGNASTDAQMRKSKKGDVTFAAFGLAVSNSKERTSFFPIVLFGQQADTFVKQITKGRQVLVEGRIEVNNGRFNVIADRIVLGVLPQQPAPKDEKTKIIQVDGRLAGIGKCLPARTRPPPIALMSYKNIPRTKVEVNISCDEMVSSPHTSRMGNRLN